MMCARRIGKDDCGGGGLSPNGGLAITCKVAKTIAWTYFPFGILRRHNRLTKMRVQAWLTGNFSYGYLVT